MRQFRGHSTIDSNASLFRINCNSPLPRVHVKAGRREKNQHARGESCISLSLELSNWVRLSRRPSGSSVFYPAQERFQGNGFEHDEPLASIPSRIFLCSVLSLHLSLCTCCALFRTTAAANCQLYTHFTSF